MKFALPIAAALAIGAATSAFAAQPAPRDFLGLGAAEMVESIETPYHRCHGRNSGTAHESCGTLTGGPVGGLVQ